MDHILHHQTIHVFHGQPSHSFPPFFKSSIPHPPKFIILVFRGDPDLTHFRTSSPSPSPLHPSISSSTFNNPTHSSMDLSDLHHLFQMFDHNGDGKITIQELSKSLESLGIDIPDADLEHMIDHIDIDGDGMVNMDEFTGLYKMLLMEEERDEEEDLREAFNVFDKNGDGFISVEELQSVMMSLGLRQGRTIEDCQLMVNKVDIDGDGMVDYKEFRQMMKGGGFAAL